MLKEKNNDKTNCREKQKFLYGCLGKLDNVNIYFKKLKSSIMLCNNSKL